MASETFLEKCLRMKASKAINKGSSRSYRLARVWDRVLVMVDPPMLLMERVYTFCSDL